MWALAPTGRWFSAVGADAHIRPAEGDSVGVRRAAQVCGPYGAGANCAVVAADLRGHFRTDPVHTYRCAVCNVRANVGIGPYGVGAFPP